MVSSSFAIWIALTAAGAALLGAWVSVWLTGKHSDQQLTMRLQHEAQRLEKERALQLRRDVYLPAAEAIAGIASTLGRVVHLGAPEQELSTGIGRYVAALARVQLIAGAEAVEAVSTLQREISATMLFLLGTRAPLVLRQGDIDAARKSVQKFATDMEAANASMRDIDAADKFDQHRWDAAELQLEFARTQHLRHWNEWKALTSVQNRERLRYTETAIRDIVHLGGLMAPAMVSLRAELGLPDGAEVLASQLHETSRRMQEVMQQSLASLRTELEQMEAEAVEAKA